MHKEKPKNKTLACYLALFLGFVGAHIWYLGKHMYWGLLHIVLTIVGGSAWLYFLTSQNMDSNTSTENIWLWIGLSLFVLNWCILWLTCIIYGLMPQDKWLLYVNKNYNINTYATQNNTKYERYAHSNALTVLCIIMALLMGAGSLMAFLSFAIQIYYLS